MHRAAEEEGQPHAWQTSVRRARTVVAASPLHGGTSDGCHAGAHCKHWQHSQEAGALPQPQESSRTVASTTGQQQRSTACQSAPPPLQASWQPRVDVAVSGNAAASTVHRHAYGHQPGHASSDDDTRSEQAGLTRPPSSHNMFLPATAGAAPPPSPDAPFILQSAFLQPRHGALAS